MVRTLSSNVGGAGSIPAQGAKIPHASRPKKKKKQTQSIKQKPYCKKLNKKFLNGPH